MACVSTLLILLSVDRDRRALARRSRAADLTVILANTDLGKQCDDFGVDRQCTHPGFGDALADRPPILRPPQIRSQVKGKRMHLMVRFSKPAVFQHRTSGGACRISLEQAGCGRPRRRHSARDARMNPRCASQRSSRRGNSARTQVSYLRDSSTARHSSPGLSHCLEATNAACGTLAASLSSFSGLMTCFARFDRIPTNC